MAKNSVRDFDATAANNTDIQSVDIAENCAPSGINNAIRELMADIKNVSTGTIALESPSADSLTVTGDLTVDTNTLYVDSTNNNVGIGGTPASGRTVHVQGTGFTEMVVEKTDATTAALLLSADSGLGSIYTRSTVSDSTAIPLTFHTGNTESMRIDSSGNVGLGTSSITSASDNARNLVINDASGNAGLTIRTEVASGYSSVHFGDSASYTTGRLEYRHGDDAMVFSTNGGNERVRIDSSGNLLVGRTSTISSSSSSDVGHDFRSNGTAIHYRNGGPSLFLGRQSSDGDIVLFYKDGSPVGVIGTQNWGIGTSSPDSPLHISASAGPYIRIENTDTSLTEGQITGGIIFEQNDSTAGATGITGRIQMRSVDRPDTGTYFGTAANMDFLVSGSSSGDASDNASKTAMTIDAGTGDVAIGSLSASGKLFVNQTSSSSVASYTYANNGAYTGVSDRNRCARTGSSGYYLYWGESGNGADVEFYVRGDGIVRADGSIAGGGADYAEMFEWDDGNSSNEDRRGFSVVLTNGNKIRKATSSDAAADIIGVVSANPTVLGDAEPMKWSGKYNTDDFGNYIMETYTLTEWTEPAVTDDDGEVTQEAVEHSYETDKIPSDLTVPSDAVVSSADGDGNTLKRRQLNPSYDDTQTYTPREERQEWDAIGLMGKLRMRTGQPTGDRWIKMRDIATDDDGNVTVEEWLIR